MFKLKSHSKDRYTSTAIMLGSGVDDGSETNYNTLHIAVFGHSWWFHIPKIIFPKRKWVDTSKYEWNAGKEGPHGYWDVINKEYGIIFSDDYIHVRYGIQPGGWSRDDQENSDHTKLFAYPWNYEHVRHDAYSVDGKFLCSGKHWQKYEELWKYRFCFPGDPDCNHVWVDSENLNEEKACAVKVK